MNTLFKTITNSAYTSSQQDESVIPLSQTMLRSSQIIIKDLELKMVIGIHDFEKAKKQRVIVNLDLDVQPNENWRDDNINGVLSYAEIVEAVEKLSHEKNSVQLVETFAEMILELCFSYPTVKKATVSVDKPDIMKNSRSVGVKITRERL